LDETHDPRVRSWVASANDPESPFPIQNLPYGSFRRAESEEGWRLGIAIGDQVLDLRAAVANGLLNKLPAAVLEAASAERLNPLLDQTPSARIDLRRAVFALLHVRSDPSAQNLLHPAAEVELRVPMAVGDYTDFFSSLHHAKRTARLLRGATDVGPNYRHLPIGYHGRASSIVVSGTPVRRPNGQSLPAGAAAPSFGPTQRLDFELEVAAVIGGGNRLGEPISIDQAEDHLFGLCLMNDWSARDLQAFEYQPLGPFLGKSFATTLSPWVVTMDALRPFREPLDAHKATDPVAPVHLSDADAGHAGIALGLSASLRTAKMQAIGLAPLPITRPRLSTLYWSFAQMIAHHTSNGCNLRSGDVLGSGTVSGAALETAGCLLELSEAGARALPLGNGEHRTYLEDGDMLIIEGMALRDGYRSIGFGPCAGEILPALRYGTV
jgi:fumarylacetoacetase